ncbi:MAG: efflux RND transporter permease subunit [Bacteroidales bacterium]|nr:efflux RND transporter permease subunit [Bacteroidales bacterium]
MSIYRTAVNNPVTTAMIFIAFAVFGIFSLMKLPIDNFPEIDASTIMVMSSYQGASAEDVENNLAKILENSLNGVEHLKHITTNSKENVCVVTLEFEQGVDIDVATNDVRDKLDMVNSVLPDGASLPMIFKFSMDDMPILILSATATTSVNALEKILDDKISTPLARISGDGTISIAGATEREIQIYCDPVKLQAYGLTVTGISQTIAAENRNIPSGNIDIGSNTYIVRVEKEFDAAAELLDVIVGHQGNKIIYLRDVARVQDSVKERAQESYTNGTQGARIIIQKRSGANTVNVIRAVKREMKKIEKTLPSDIKIETVSDSSRYIINSINSLKETIITTFLLVMLVVFVFLGRWRATFIIVLAIPISLLASIVYLFATDSTLNVISMSALSIAIGMVVDDAIVVLENVSNHLYRGEKPKEAAVHATGEVGISVIASTLTMLAVFLPLTMIKGMAGVLFRELGWIVSIIMIVSTFGALTLVPMLCSRFLKMGPKTSRIHKIIFTPIDNGLDKLSRGYSHLIGWAVTHRKTVVVIALAVFVGTLIWLGPKIKTEYFPNSDSGRITANITLPVGTAQEVTAEFAANIYQRLVSEIPEIRVLNYTFGQADSDNAFASMQQNGTNYITMTIDIGSKLNRTRSSADVAQIVRDDLYEYPIITKFQVNEGQGGMGGNASVKLEVYGYDFDTSDKVSAMLREKLKEYPCVSEAVISRDEYTPEYNVDFDRTKLALNGLSSTTAASYVSACISGSVMSFFREDGDEYDIRVRYAPEFRTGVEDIEQIVIYNAMGKAVRVGDIATVRESRIPPTITRKDRERVNTVTALVAKGYALSDVVKIAQDVIDHSEIPSEISVVIAGDYEEQQRTFKDLITLLILIVILVYMVMAAQFESFMSPFVIMFSIPFAITGVILGCVTSGYALGVMGLIGIIILMGIVVKNGIVLIDYTILCQERGMSVQESVVTAAQSRLRPILMTTLTTVLGMIPLALGRGEGAEMWNSLGVVVAWGLSISTLITLVLIPTIYCSFCLGQLKRAARKEARRQKKLLKA